MPLEVRELVIKATIDDHGSAPTGDSNTSGGTADCDEDLIVSICVERVLEILKDKEER